MLARWWWLGALAALWILRPLLLVLVARVFAGAIGNKALAKQPDSIHLAARNTLAWAKPEEARALAKQLQASGFEAAGVYAIPELPGVIVQLLVHADDAISACVYEHPSVGHWLELVTRYTDGRTCSFTTSKPTGLDARPGHPVFHCPGVTVGDLLARTLADRPKGQLVAALPSDVAAKFESGWAELLAWRKTRGIQVGEVARVAQRRAA